MLSLLFAGRLRCRVVAICPLGRQLGLANIESHQLFHPVGIQFAVRFDFDIEPDHEITTTYDEDKVRLTKYYGLVPRELLEAAIPDAETHTRR